MSLESTVGIAKVGTKSLRATVPEGIVAFLGIQEGDKLVWKMEFRDNERFAIVTKKQDVNPSKATLNYTRPERRISKK